jgi:hypothetical protein
MANRWWTTPHRRPVGLSLGAVGWALACTAFEPGSDELGDPTTITAAQRPELGRDWTCLSEDPEPEALFVSAESAPRLVHSMQLLGIASGIALPGLSVRACAQRDLDCTSPLTADIAVNLDGWVDIPLYEGFDGYVEVVGEAIVPSALFFSEPLNREGLVEHLPIGLVERAALPTLSRAVGTIQDENLGVVYERAFDCRLDDARGLTYSLDRGGSPWYFVGGLPTAMVDETVDSSLGGFLNVEAGIAVLSAELPGVRQIGAAETVIVRGGWITGLRFVPKLARALPRAE